MRGCASTGRRCRNKKMAGMPRPFFIRSSERLLRRLALRPDRLESGGAELELRNLAERVELRIGEQVRRRLDIGERDEHNAVRYRVVLTRVQFDRATPCGDADHVAGLDAELGDCATRHLCDGRGLD